MNTGSGPSSSERTIVHDRIDKMTRALRVLGAVLLLTSASTFVVQRWEGGHDLLRFGFLLCHSFVILGAALFCGGKLGESRSARVFLWTNLAMIPAHFAVLGGLIYSQFSLDSVGLELPSYAVWEAPTRISAVLVMIGAYVTVLSTGLISARVLVPRRGRGITLLFVGLCSLLLIPLRNANAAALLASLAALSALWFDRKKLLDDYRLRTLEGRLVRSLLAVPSLLLVGRAALFYPTTDVFSGVLILVTSCVGFILTRSIKNNRASVDAGEWLASLGGCVGVLFILGGTGLYDELGVLSWSLCSGVFILASRFSKGGRTNFEAGAALVAVFTCGLSLGLEPTMTSGVCALVVGAVALCHSILMGRGLVGASAALCTLGGILVVFDRIVGFEHLGGWGALSILGILAVVSAAVLERHRDAILRGALSRFLNERSGKKAEERGPLQDGHTELSPSVATHPG